LAATKEELWEQVQLEVGGHSHDLPCTWRLSWLAVEKPWLAMAGPDIEKAPLPCRGSISGTVDSFQSGDILILK